MQQANKNMDDYLVRLRNSQKLNQACNGSLITIVVEEHGMKILKPLHVTGFYAIQEGDKKESKTAGE